MNHVSIIKTAVNREIKQQVWLKWLLFGVILLGSLCLGKPLKAQILQQDTIQADTRYPYIQYTQDRHSLFFQNLDTTLQQFHLYNPARQANYENFFLGNIGQAHQSVVFDFDRTVGFQLGFRQFNHYLYKEDSIKYFMTPYPMADLQYVLASLEEQIVGINFAQGLNKNLTWQLDYRRIISPSRENRTSIPAGSYENQRSAYHNFNANIWKRSKNRRYNLISHFLINTAEVQQNGGISLLPEVFIADSVTSRRDTTYRRLYIDTLLQVSNSDINTNLSNATSVLKQHQWMMQQTYDWGKKYVLVDADSVEYPRFIPKQRLGHALSIGREKYEYTDNFPNEDFYNTFKFSSQETVDRMAWWNVRNEFFGVLLGNEYNPYSDVINQKYALKAGLTHHVIRLRYLDQLDTLYNITDRFGTIDTLLSRQYERDLRQSAVVFGQFVNNPITNQALKYWLEAKYVLFGFNWGDFDFNARLRYQLSEQLGGVSGRFALKQLTPDFISQFYYGNHDEWRGINDKKINVLHFGGTYFHPKLRLKVAYDNYTLEDYIIWNELAEPEQLTDEIINISRLSIEHQLKLGKFYLDNLIVLQADNSNKINLPIYWGRQSVYFMGNLFKNAMLAQIGFDVQYNTPYRLNAYDPVLGQFHLQQEEIFPFYPVVDAYINMKVKRLKLFVLVQHANQGLFRQKNYYMAQDYPAYDRAFKLGVHWRFFD